MAMILILPPPDVDLFLKGLLQELQPDSPGSLVAEVTDFRLALPGHYRGQRSTREIRPLRVW